MTLQQMSFSGAVLILVIVFVRALLLHKLPKKTFLALWMVVLLRLLIPFSFSSSLSVYTLAEKYTPVMDITDRLQESLSFHSETKSVSQNPSEAENPSQSTLQGTPDAADSSWNVSQLPTGAAASSRSTTQNFPDAVASSRSASQNFQNRAASPFIWTILWAIGFTLCLGYFLFSYIKCYRNFQTALPAGQEALRKWHTVHSLRRKLSIRQSDRIASPLSYGILYPVILMPKATDWSDTRQLWYVLEHEYIHIQRFDALTKLVMAAALCIHWFNPFVWVMYLLFNRDIELSCDESVIRRFGENTKSAYAMTLISMEEKKGGPSPLYSSFSKNAIEERIRAIMKIRKVTLLSCALAAVLVAGITAAFATSASAPDKTEGNPAIGQTKVGYDIDEITARMTELNLLIDENEKELDFLLNEQASSMETDDLDILNQEIEAAKEEQHTLTSMLDDLETQQFFNTTYGAYGIHYELPENRLYKGKKSVQYFYDKEEGKALWADNEGELYVEVIRDSNGEILRLKEETSLPDNADNTDRSDHATENFDLSFQATRHGIAHSVSENERFYEYEKFGLSYDNVTGYLMYDGKTVGYFKDEYEPGTYTRFTDEGGELGVIVVRNESREIIGFQVDSISECEAFDTDESSDAVQNSDGGSAPGISSETNDSTLSVPSEYAAFGISVDTKANLWTYHGKGIAAIYDDDGGIYTTDNVPADNAVYLEVERDSNDTITRLKEITKEEMQTLFDNIRFHETAPGERVAVEAQ